MKKGLIVIKGAKENNLKNVNLKIPRDKLVVFTGVSGSGKSSLAFDTIFADGQRRYMEGLSSYARQFLGQMKKPNVESIEGLSPAISIDQKTTSNNPRSTVGTVTEIYDYLRLLYARVGVPHCPVCGKEIKSQTVDDIVSSVLNFPVDTKILLLAPIVRNRRGEHVKVIEKAKLDGFTRIRIDKKIYSLTEQIELAKNKKHNIEIVVDRLVVSNKIKSRLTDSLDTCLKLTGGVVVVNKINTREDILYSDSYACLEHDISIEKLTPRMFSFNSPYGACDMCTGLGVLIKVSPDLVIADENLSLRQGAIRAPGWNYGEKEGICNLYFDALSKKYNFSLDVAYKDLPEDIKNIMLYGTNGEKVTLQRNTDFIKGTYEMAFSGVVNNLQKRYKETKSDWIKNDIAKYMTETVCPKCGGDRLNKHMLSVTFGGKNISELTRFSIDETIEFLKCVELSEKDRLISSGILKEIFSRLYFLQSVGLNYLTLARSSKTLSGGESQRIRLATQIGSSLVGVLYILDEPSIGLHQRDNFKLIETLKKLRDIGNSVIVVEHDEDTIRAADWVVDVGPGAGVHGGNIIYSGALDGMKDCKNSLTADYIFGRKNINVPQKRREGDGKFLEFFGCAENNLKNIDVKIPLRVLTCITGVSGSGKSSLLNEIIYKSLAEKLNKSTLKVGNFREAKGFENLDKIVNVDQSPIGKIPRSNPGTYTGVFSFIRELFASTNYAKEHGFSPSRFSFNVKGGRCDACQGDGLVKIEMHFLPDIYVPCEVCKGKRYNLETLKVFYKEKNIYDVLEMTVEEALGFFENHEKINRKLKALFDVGLGYIKIGQSAITLSGGEAQRVKLATELSKKPTGKTIYILDEPTTGLHTDDVRKLIEILNRLVELKNTVIVIEHNLDVIKTADYIIDLGPEGGVNGGTVVECGTPEKVAANERSYTGRYLKKLLPKNLLERQ